MPAKKGRTEEEKREAARLACKRHRERHRQELAEKALARYHANKTSINRARHKKYVEDAEYREKRRRYRALNIEQDRYYGKTYYWRHRAQRLAAARIWCVKNGARAAENKRKHELFLDSMRIISAFA